MQITEYANDKSLALAVRTQVVVMDLVDRAGRRLREERGQTAIEYAGILAFIGVLFAAIFTTHLDNAITRWANKLIHTIDGQGGGGGGGGGNGGKGGGG
jgi:Flp pilus assembly pilin Flp